MGGSGFPPPSELLPLLPLLLRLSLVSTVLWLRRLRVGDKIWGRGCWGAAPPPSPLTHLPGADAEELEEAEEAEAAGESPAEGAQR